MQEIYYKRLCLLPIKLVLCWGQNKFFLVYESLYICFPFTHQVWNLCDPGNLLGEHRASFVRVSYEYCTSLARKIVRSPSFFVYVRHQGPNINNAENTTTWIISFPSTHIIHVATPPAQHSQPTRISMLLMSSHSNTNSGPFPTAFVTSQPSLGSISDRFTIQSLSKFAPGSISDLF